MARQDGAVHEFGVLDPETFRQQVLFLIDCRFHAECDHRWCRHTRDELRRTVKKRGLIASLQHLQGVTQFSFASQKRIELRDGHFSTGKGSG
ncbi:hypothetical protein BXU09_17780 [Deinococcus sp. LM3]|nr:hypothetical protein BXU09_17780 [Deinococcus sp. LM3]